MTTEEEIQFEAAACRKSFEGVGVGAIVQHFHHEEWLERLTGLPENRILSILNNKQKHEQAERLRRFRPLAYADWKKADAAWKKADADWRKAYADCNKAYAELNKASRSSSMIAFHSKLCGCAWNATTDIFGKARR